MKMNKPTLDTPGLRRTGFAAALRSGVAIATLALLACLPRASAQISTVVFQDDFSSTVIDPAKYTPDAPFFEGGKGDIHAEAKDGAIEFVGTTTQQWWSGGTLAIAPTFTASEAAPVSITIDRVAEVGQGSASRSALWILDETKTKYVLFADVRGEGGWRYNRKIGEDGDVPTGSGTDIAAFNGDTYDDGGLHKMSIVANGKTVKLILDGKLGTEVKFPVSKVVFQFGSYARANNDTAATKWDNLKIEVAKPTSVVFSDDFSKGTIDPAKYQPDAPFFEGGKGDIHAEAKDGAIEFVGTTTTQWWSGGTLRVVPTFSATEETPVLITLDRVKEAGQGSASRSALWILDETQSKYVLFADVRGEGGWRYNRKIGEDGDVPTGSGTDIAAFNGGTFDDGGLRKMSILANGKTVKLMLDGQVGAEVKFPFSKVMFHFGSYARANNDTAATTFDNIKIETVVRQSSVVFQDDFASNTIDPAKYAPDAPFFEGGKGDIHAELKNGTLEFVGTTTQQWWSGGTLRIVPTFDASDEATLTLTVDRVSETGQGSASRSALWILDSTQTKYVLFADVRGEGGWRYNRKIGEDGDVPTGSGTDIAAFNGASFDDGGLHKMSIVADGKTVKLLLDGQQGAEVKFPFSPVVFHLGSYARANNDTAATVWDNLKIETAGGAGFLPKSSSVRLGGTGQAITVRIPAGLNSSAPVTVRVVSADPSIAVPDGGTGGSLTLTFPAGGANTQTFKARGVALGGTTFGVEGDIASSSPLTVAVISGPGVQMDEAFGGAVDAAKWTTSNLGFETTGTGAYTVGASGGVLNIEGAADGDYWSGASLKSVKSFVATRDLTLSVEVDRVSLDQPGTAARSGVFITTGDRSKFVFFGQNAGENGWQVNVNPGSATGGGANIAVFDGLDADLGKHHMKLVADGERVEVFLDGVSGGKFPLEASSGLFVELGGYARAAGDTVKAVFDNVHIENALPCLTATPSNVSITQADAGQLVTVTVPQLLNDAAPVTVTVTSRNPAIAVPAGAVNGVLTLNFAAGAANTQTITVSPTGLGSTGFDIASTPSVCVTGSVAVEVVAVPQVLLADDFASAIDAANWKEDATGFDSGTATADSGVKVENGQVKFTVTVENAPWPGLALLTAKTYSAKATEPVTFEIDRTLLDFDLTTGTGAEQRTGIWIKDAGGNFVLFAEHAAHDGRNFGWGYNKQTGAADDNATNDGTNIAAFDGGTFDDQKKHHLKMVANGATVKLFLDGVFGVEVPFPSATGLTFGFGAYTDEAGNVVRGTFDNAKISGGSAPTTGRFSGATVQGGNVVITWTGGGVLQSTDSIAPATWKDVSPAPTGNSLSVPSGAAATRFYRLRQ
jgi:hypothetical protein